MAGATGPELRMKAMARSLLDFDTGYDQDHFFGWAGRYAFPR